MRVVTFAILNFYTFLAICQKKEISIQIIDNFNQKAVLDCDIIIKNKKKTLFHINEKEILKIKIDTGFYEIIINQINFKTLNSNIFIHSDTTIFFQIESLPRELNEFEIIDTSKYENIQFQSDITTINTKYIKKLPTLIGETDIYKFVQQMPGVAITGEGSGSLHVRGGEANENIILLDNSPIYEPNHILGLISVFDSDYISEATLLKNGVSAAYGGKLSSLLKLTSKVSNFKKPNFKLGIGFISSKIFTDIPIIKNKLSLIFNARKSNINYLLSGAKIFTDKINQNNELDFYDFNSKIEFKSDKWNSFISVYYGNDLLKLSNTVDLEWGNQNINYKTIYKNKKHEIGFQAGYSMFYFQLKIADNDKNLSWKCGINDFHSKIYFKQNLKHTTFNVGLDVSYKNINPTQYEPINSRSIFKPIELQKYKTLEVSPYVDLNYYFNQKISIKLGIRVPNYCQLGNYTEYFYKDNKTLLSPEIIDSIKYENNEIFNKILKLEPRITITYLLNYKITFNASYNRNYQFINQIITGITPLPISFWMPTTRYFEPSYSDKFSVGLNYIFSNTLSFNSDIFLNLRNNLLDFIDNSDIFLNKNFITQIRTGTGKSFGIETSFSKKIGRLTGSISYTLSKSTRLTDDINQGLEYAASSDRRHILNFFMSYELSKKISLGASFNYATGRPITLPSGAYNFQDYTVSLISDRNGYRMPDFHHLDLNVTYKPFWKKHPQLKSNWTFNIYNIYGRKNPFLVYTKSTFDANNENTFLNQNQNQVFMLYLFSIIPSLRYSLEF